MNLLLTFFVLSLVFSFLCSLWEAVLLSITHSYVQLHQSTRIGKILKGFKESIDIPLAAILSLNTIAHTVGAIGVGEQATKIWGDTNPWITGFVVPVGMTAAILFLSEVIPKTLGANFWKRFAPFTGASLVIVVFLFRPIVWICQLVTRFISPKGKKDVFSRLDFLALAEIGSIEGDLHATEIHFIQNVLEFRNLKVREIMTPRPVLVTASEEATFTEFASIEGIEPFSRIPLKRGEEMIVGYVLKSQVYALLNQGEKDRKLHEIGRKIPIVPETYSIFTLFHDLLKKREHIALVVDEYGGTAGIVTLEDILETLLGTEIVDETDHAVDMQEVAKKLHPSSQEMHHESDHK